MKKTENLGKALGKNEQRKISGGGPTDYYVYCNTSYGGPFSQIGGAYPNHPQCVTARNAACAQWWTYTECYCTTDLGIMHC